ncbi:right-handed parallel beta-helix repeat-containing protein [Pontiella sulfatireligans]|uniref:GH141-like insertion domain-containing protein n=1 Tax=Pontiella sulfatireligans TaxID=2750658 RepID=A0A6C2UMX4_9BACT|nr:right-handed parallel beta-helix repeat-containing protein [Pontiella sulfatireligans]VGO20664.1 hypothetical protein SCARR_02730 [Pontiella sulfatireligans]
MKLNWIIIWVCAAAAQLASGMELYVCPEGADESAGTRDAPFKTIVRAQQAVRLIDKSIPGETVVTLRGGTYLLEQTVVFDARDSGTEQHPVTYRAFSGEVPVISGGRQLTGWKKNGTAMWEAPVGDLDFRQLYVNGTRAPRSRHPNSGYLRVNRWNDENRTILLPAGSLQEWRNFDEVEIYIQMQWSIAVMRLESFAKAGPDFVLTVNSPERDLVFKRMHPKRKPEQAFHYENAREFIDVPGEWSLSRKEGVCAYLPRDGENMACAEVIVPNLETLFRIQGTLDEPVRHLGFEGLTFMHSNWTLPSHQGYLNVQAGQYSIEPTQDDVQYVGRPPAAVYAACVENLVFKRNVFKKLGAVGLDIHYGSLNNDVVGNVFYDISGSAISHARLSGPDVEIHTPYQPADKRDRCVGDRIRNNYIYSVGFEYGGSVGLLCGYPTAVEIDHNELRNLSYSGISVGWGWTAEPNAMRDNMIRWNLIDQPMKLFNDGAGIYTLSEMPGTLISRNYVTGINKSEWAGKVSTKCYYLDEHSGGITFDKNYWAASSNVERMFFHQPGAIQITPFDKTMYPEIKAQAGLEPEYKDIKKLAVD